MKATKKQDAIEVIAEEVGTETQLERTIETALVKANVTDKVLSELKERYSGIKLKSIDDKESYLECKEARKEVRKVGIIAEKICKLGREDAVKVQKMWLSKEKEILSKIAEVQDPLDAEIKKFDDEVERKEQEEKKRQEEQFMNRQSMLLKYGAVYSNGSFELKHISYESDLIKQADDDMWNDTILPKYRKVFEEVETERVAEENRRKEEMERQRKQQEELERQAAELRKQQEEFARQQAELQKQKDEIEKQHRMEQEKAELEVRRARQEKINSRYNQLTSLGMQYNGQYGCYVYEDVNVDNATEISLLDDKQWEELIDKITPVIEEKKKLAEQKRLAELEKEKRVAIELAAQQERERIQEEQRQAELKKQQDEARRQQELEIAGDKEKYAEVVKYLKDTPVFLMKSPTYRNKMNQINAFIANL